MVLPGVRLPGRQVLTPDEGDGDNHEDSRIKMMTAMRIMTNMNMLKKIVTKMIMTTMLTMMTMTMTALPEVHLVDHQVP